MTAAVLADFGSTFTKVAVVELGSGRLLGRAQSPTTVESDVMRGYRTALDSALEAVEGPVSLGPRLAASSAAGGLRVAAIGLVGDLTAAAARQAALNAGARVEVVLSGRLGEAERIALLEAGPEVVLFCGGTDGGQEAMVLANAEAVAAEPLEAHFVVACNAGIADRVGAILGRHGARVDVVANVMPRIGELEVEPARAAISDAFVRHVIQGKGLSSEEEFSRDVIMPTPEAVLRATRLLAQELGDVVVVDIGGATTDVHSASEHSEPPPGVTGPLLPVLPVLRSVQGDLGVRSNAPSVLASDGEWLLRSLAMDAASAEAAAAMRARDHGFVAADARESSIDRALAVACVHHAIRRHCGRLTITSAPNQPARIGADGPDLRRAPLLLGTGGMLVRAHRGEDILSEALERLDDRSLAPREPGISVDHDYLLAAAGLLADIDRPAAAALMRLSLRPR
ncbi:MAG TPA: glutamate mutase L [Solirubrobacteraceae bacterium]|nr:glutamate mutase L [Solirubrobacteraceae bacterium]